jgi:hypothetical protein
MSTGEPKKRGCFGRVLRSAFVLVALAAIIAVAVSMIGGDGETHTLHGEIMIMNGANFTAEGEGCSGTGGFASVEGGASLVIVADNGDWIETPLLDGVLSPEGNCRFAFAADVPAGERATFHVGSQSQIQRINKERADQFREGASSNDWWVSVQFDTNE